MNPRNIVFVSVAVLGLAFDQLSKWWVASTLQQDVDEITVIPGFFSIVHRQNPGAAFGMFRDFEYRHWLFLVFTLVAAAVIVDLFRRLPRNDKFMAATLGLILSGALGNAIDRVAKHTVTDFLKVYTDSPSLVGWLHGHGLPTEWPSFNVADSALVVGVAMYLFHQLFLEDRSGRASELEEKPTPSPEPEGEASPDEVQQRSDTATSGV
ncbi:MAG: signal peptidase II [Myxococcota bacterium]